MKLFSTFFCFLLGESLTVQGQVYLDQGKLAVQSCQTACPAVSPTLTLDMIYEEGKIKVNTLSVKGIIPSDSNDNLDISSVQLEMSEAVQQSTENETDSESSRRRRDTSESGSGSGDGSSDNLIIKCHQQSNNANMEIPAFGSHPITYQIDSCQTLDSGEVSQTFSCAFELSQNDTALLNWEYTAYSMLDIKAKAIDSSGTSQVEIEWKNINLVSPPPPTTAAPEETTLAAKELKNDNVTYESFESCVETINPLLHEECSTKSSSTKITFSIVSLLLLLINF